MNETESTAKQLDVETLRHQLDTQLFGTGERLVYMPIVDSTNTQAMYLARNGSEEGVVVLTDSQTAGKGRQGRRWVDTFGRNVLLSTILRPLFSPYLLVMMASLAVTDAITEVCGVEATIKWPNDVLIGDRKVSGILIETSHDHTGRMVAIMGIGVNVNGQSVSLESPPEEMTRATTLEAACGHTVSRETFIAYLLRCSEAAYIGLKQEAANPVSTPHSAQSTSRLIRERWRNQLSTLRRTIQVRQGDTLINGIAEDVNDNGELLLRCHSGERVTITWGDVGYPTK